MVPFPPLKSGLRPASATTGKSRLPSRLPKRRRSGLPGNEKIETSRRRTKKAAPSVRGTASLSVQVRRHILSSGPRRPSTCGQGASGKEERRVAGRPIAVETGYRHHDLDFPFVKPSTLVLRMRQRAYGDETPRPRKAGRGYPLRTPERHPQAAEPYAGRDVRRKAPSLPSPDGSTGSSLP